MRKGALAANGKARLVRGLDGVLELVRAPTSDGSKYEKTELGLLREKRGWVWTLWSS